MGYFRFSNTAGTHGFTIVHATFVRLKRSVTTFFWLLVANVTEPARTASRPMTMRYYFMQSNDRTSRYVQPLQAGDESHTQVSIGSDIASRLQERLEAIELYVRELIDVMNDYEVVNPTLSRDKGKTGQSLSAGEHIPVEFLKRDLLNLITESHHDAQRLRRMLRMASARKPNVFKVLN